MILSTGCPHCPAVLQGLSELIKTGSLHKLEVLNLEDHTEIAESYGVRSVPFVKLGPFELEGLISPAELKTWVNRASSQTGLKEYLSELLNSGGISKAESIIKSQTGSFPLLLQLFTDSDTSLNIKIGISALIEQLATDSITYDHIDEIGSLTLHNSPEIRIDGSHFLALTGNSRAIPYLEKLLTDSDAQVRETATECLQELNSTKTQSTG